VELQRKAARELRRNSTDAERRLWDELRNYGIGGYYFRRQYPIDPYIVDFVCRTARVVIEVDGEYHSAPAQITADLERTSVLQDLGYSILRFSNDEVLTQTKSVLERIVQQLRTQQGMGRGPSPPRLCPLQRQSERPRSQRSQLSHSHPLSLRERGQG
jgi:very-short-patch-repair endonuclease